MAIVRYERGKVPQTMTPEQIASVKAMTPEEVEAGALSDPDNPPATEEEMMRGLIGRDIRLLRQSLGLSQTQFAERFQINPARLRDWEQGRHMPDSVALAYLRVIRHDAAVVERALAEAKSPA